MGVEGERGGGEGLESRGQRPVGRHGCAPVFSCHQTSVTEPGGGQGVTMRKKSVVGVGEDNSSIGEGGADNVGRVIRHSRLLVPAYIA